jgi:hypothetical protein
MDEMKGIIELMWTIGEMTREEGWWEMGDGRRREEKESVGGYLYPLDAREWTMEDAKRVLLSDKRWFTQHTHQKGKREGKGPKGK